ncbi:MAG: ABC transporter substrate-binding protein [Lachnospiraceae bacterium]|nr:ABC transporter substrate-binding protein [Lachnospiraceae bacterium]
MILITGCAQSASRKVVNEQVPEAKEDLIVIGFSQVGAESDWRKENSESMRSTFTRDKGYELIFEDAQQKQQNQITAIRTFIQREVDYIVLAPVTEDGWDTVLGEAKDAGIPVIIVDRMVNVDDDSLFTCWVGSDFKLESRKACAWLKSYLERQHMDPGDVNIVDIQGTIGSSAQIGRTTGLRDAVIENGWRLLDAVPGEYTQAKGREAAARMLEKYDNINVVYCENDNEAFGAIEALEAAGKKAGGNIRGGEVLVMSFDGVSRQALENLRNGSISCIGECNPLHGPRVKKIIENLEAGQTPDKYEYVEEDVFSGYERITEVTVDGTSYPVKIMGK